MNIAVFPELSDVKAGDLFVGEFYKSLILGLPTPDLRSKQGPGPLNSWLGNPGILVYCRKGGLSEQESGAFQSISEQGFTPSHYRANDFDAGLVAKLASLANADLENSESIIVAQSPVLAYMDLSLVRDTVRSLL